LGLVKPVRNADSVSVATHRGGQLSKRTSKERVGKKKGGVNMEVIEFSTVVYPHRKKKNVLEPGSRTSFHVTG